MTRKLEVGDYAQKDGRLFKLIHYVGYLTKEPFTAQYGKISTSYNPPEEVILSPLFFRGDVCLNCNRCCKDFTTTFTESGKDRILSATKADYDVFDLAMDRHSLLLDKLTEAEILLNGKPVKFYAYFHPAESRKTRRCDFLLNGRCGIHPVKSVTCALPHMNFFYSSRNNKTYIRRQQFGRNFYLQCPTVFSAFDYESYKSWDLVWLKKLEEVSNDMGISTYLPDVLAYLDSIDDELKAGIIPTEKLIFSKTSIPTINTATRKVTGPTQRKLF